MNPREAAPGAAAPDSLADAARVAADRWSLFRTLARGMGHGLANAAQMLELEPLPASARIEAREHVRVAIDQLADVHRSPAPAPTVVADVIAGVAAAQRLQAAYRSTELALDVATGLPAVRLAAADLAHVLLALVTNAKQAAGERRAAIRVRAVAERGGVAIDVEDDGPGFDAGVLAQADRAHVTTRPGERLGLGLYVARVLLERAGGTLALRGTPARVRLWLPAWPPAGAAR